MTLWGKWRATSTLCTVEQQQHQQQQHHQIPATGLPIDRAMLHAPAPASIKRTAKNSMRHLRAFRAQSVNSANSPNRQPARLHLAQFHWTNRPTLYCGTILYEMVEDKCCWYVFFYFWILTDQGHVAPPVICCVKRTKGQTITARNFAHQQTIFTMIAQWFCCCCERIKYVL